MKTASKLSFPSRKAAYERFAAHAPPASILKYYGLHENLPAGIVLERATNQNVFTCLWRVRQRHATPPNDATLFRWAGQAADALAFAHSLNIFNCDIHCVNFFLDEGLKLKVGDRAGASIDGSTSHSLYRLRHRLFEADGTDVARVRGAAPAMEIFALGTAIYYMITGHDPWPEFREPEDREEIKRKIITKDFLATSRDICRRCWHVEFQTMTEVKLAIETERDSNPKVSRMHKLT
ncbi:hypothetical protein LTR09_008174 [Extremus antarcticus]|uniref:Protein kinase domain-containing protein n=1 Tax=Extremus antarcticus TaxID=702011 RepID=A0AAJ0DHS7_9PEZI|nr:hypothetical protein LTR09_008174 [Extremus antarcticus]